MPPGIRAVGAAFAPRGHAFALVRSVRPRRSEVVVVEGRRVRRVFTGAGRFTDVEWSPDGRWLLIAWADADQWVFIRSAGVRRIDAVSRISAQFESARFPSLAGWCCP